MAPVIGAWLLATGCVRVYDSGMESVNTKDRVINLQKVKNIPRVVVTRDVVHGVHLEWRSTLHQRYEVKYREPGAAVDDYRVLPGAGNLMGTGEIIRIRDPSPTAPRRRYRVLPLDLNEKIRIE